MQQQRDTFAKKFEELVQIRQTATEILMAEQKIVYEARLQGIYRCFATEYELVILSNSPGGYHYRTASIIS